MEINRDAVAIHTHVITVSSAEADRDVIHPCYKRSECSESNRVDKMLDIAQCAKKQLLKEKIKAKLETKIGAKLDKVADLLVDTMLEECEIDRESKELRSELKEKMSEIFSEKTNK